jgi:hypothetical protein
MQVFDDALDLLAAFVLRHIADINSRAQFQHISRHLSGRCRR